MRTVVKHAAEPGWEVRDDWPEPVAGPGEVLLEVAAASLCGTDRELHEWTPSAQAFALSPPVVLGHEGAGTVLAVGEGVTLEVGTRVALESHLVCGRCHPCRSGSAHTCERTRILGMHIDGVFAERVAVPADICVPLPESVSLEEGALLESAGVAMHAVQRSGHAVAGGYTLVNGCGPVGLVLVQLAQAMGAPAVVAVEPNAYRRAQAAAYGAIVLDPTADDVVARCRDLAGPRGGFDVAFEVSGAGGVLPTLFESLRREATLVTVGHPSAPAPIDVAAYVNKKGVTLRGIFGRRLWESWDDLLPLVSSGRVDLLSLVTHRLGLEDADEAVALLTGDAGKVLLVP